MSGLQPRLRLIVFLPSIKLFCTRFQSLDAFEQRTRKKPRSWLIWIAGPQGDNHPRITINAYLKWSDPLKIRHSH
jgi:hypothetical protein